MIRDVALIILFDKDKKILLQHRSEDAERLAGYWGFFGGGIEQGETPEQAVRRETLEELNYQLENPKLMMTNQYAHEDRKGVQYIFMEEYDENKKLALGEGQGMGWFRLDELNELKIISFDLEALKFIKGKY